MDVSTLRAVNGKGCQKVWAGDVSLGFDLQEFEACTDILGAYVVILSTGEELPKSASIR